MPAGDGTRLHRHKTTARGNHRIRRTVFGHNNRMRIQHDFPRTVGRLDNVWIPLHDGTRLAARIWLPTDAEENPVPAILEYLPYRKDDGTAADDEMRHPYFAGHGYAAVRVDLRGTGDSDGLLEGEYLEQEQEDALEVLAWLEAQEWCTGLVGMIGYSWGGFNGLQVAARHPRQLRAVVTHASTDDRYLDDCHYMGGCLLASDMLKWATSMLTYPLSPPDPRYVGDWRAVWLERLENAPELARDWVSHQRRDEFWKHGSVIEDYLAVRCPVLIVGGWADAYTNAVPRLLDGLSVPRKAIVGPWGHMLPYEGVPGPAIGFLQECLRWFDRWLKGKKSGVVQEPALRAWMQEYVEPARFHALRPGRWTAQDTWPLRAPDPLTLVLHADGSLAEEPAARAADPATVALRGDQACGEEAGVWCANGFPDEIAGDQRPDDARSLVFDTAPLDAELEVLGFPRARLRVASDRPLALVAARLEDVAPDGSSLLVSWGLLNLAHRDSHEQPEPLEPGSAYDVEVQLRTCGHRFEAGHRLRLALSPTYWPHAWPSPHEVTLSVHVNGPSTLELPVRTGEHDLPEPAFPGPEVAHPAAPGAGTRTREVTVDPETGAHEIVDRQHYERVVEPGGITHAESGTDSYSIVESDPLSARVRCTRETRSTGPDRDWRITAESEMSCDEHSFFITETYAAYDRDELIFERTRTHTVPRDHV